MNLQLVVNPAQITAADPTTLKIIDLRTAEAYAEAHIPGALHLDTSFLNRAEPPVGGLLPDAAGANALAAAIGLQKNDHVVAYDNGAGSAAARLIWVLHAYGFTSTSWLNGGFKTWVAQEHPTSIDQPTLTATDVSLQFKPGNVLSVEELQAQLVEPDIAVLDVRTPAEFTGEDVRSARGGHLPKAVHSEWTNAFDDAGLLKDDATLLAMYAAMGITDDKHVVTYCQTHQRSALTYVVLKHLGFKNVSAIDGAWSAWGNNADTPIEV